MPLFRWACDAAEEYQPIDAEEKSTLSGRAMELEAIFPQ
jgi:hypothetical protein